MCAYWLVLAGWCWRGWSLVFQHLSHILYASVVLKFKNGEINYNISRKDTNDTDQWENVLALSRLERWDTFRAPVVWQTSALTEDDELEVEFCGLAGQHSACLSSQAVVNRDLCLTCKSHKKLYLCCLKCIRGLWPHIKDCERYVQTFGIVHAIIF